MPHPNPIWKPIRNHSKVYQCHDKGQQFVANSDAADIAALLQPYFEDIAIEDLTIVVQRYKNIEAWDTNPVEPEGLEKMMDVMAAGRSAWNSGPTMTKLLPPGLQNRQSKLLLYS